MNKIAGTFNSAHSYLYNFLYATCAEFARSSTHIYPGETEQTQFRSLVGAHMTTLLTYCLTACLTLSLSIPRCISVWLQRTHHPPTEFRAQFLIHDLQTNSFHRKESASAQGLTEQPDSRCTSDGGALRRHIWELFAIVILPRQEWVDNCSDTKTQKWSFNSDCQERKVIHKLWSPKCAKCGAFDEWEWIVIVFGNQLDDD